MTDLATNAADAIIIAAVIGAALTLAGLAAAGALEVIDRTRDRLEHRRHRAAAEHAAAMDAFRRAATLEPADLEPETIEDAITRHAFDALDGLDAEGIEGHAYAATLANRIRTVCGLPRLDPYAPRARATDETRTDTLERHALDALDRLDADRLTGTRDALALARTILEAAGHATGAAAIRALEHPPTTR